MYVILHIVCSISFCLRKTVSYVVSDSAFYNIDQLNCLVMQYYAILYAPGYYLCPCIVHCFVEKFVVFSVHAILCFVSVNRMFAVNSCDVCRVFRMRQHGSSLVLGNTIPSRQFYATFIFLNTIFVSSHMYPGTPRDPSNRRLNEHGIYIRHCHE